jgi:hypothetical protein
MGQAGGFALGLVMIFVGVLALSGSAESMLGLKEAHPALAFIESAGRGLMLMFASVLPVDLAAAVHPSSGALALLGLKTQKVSARTLRRLQNWRKLAWLGLLGCAGFALFCCTFMVLTAVSFAGDMRIMDVDQNGEKDLIPVRMLGFFSVILVGFMLAAISLAPCCIYWALSMKVAAALAEDSVREVVKNVKVEAMESDDTWYNRVISPSTALANTTMRYISVGWGRGIAFAAMALWLASLSKLARFLQVTFHPDSSYRGASGIIRVLLPALACAVGPLVLALDLATVSSSCDKLVTTISNLGLEVDSVQHSARVYDKTKPLLATLKGMHAGQGIGLLV